MLVLWIILGVYLLVAVCFLITILVEVQNREINLSSIHFVVPLIWPLWALWYICVVVADWFKGRKKKS
jgi:hypothetical protein